MAIGSHIEWTEATWNPVTGCDKISPGCAHCYAERMARRLMAMGQRNSRNGFEVTLQPQALELPLRWARGKRIFVNSMSDMFHDEVPLAFILKAFDVMRRADWHQSWVVDIRDQCRSAHVSFFFKHWGGVFKKRTGRELEGRTWDEMPRRWPLQRIETVHV